MKKKYKLICVLLVMAVLTSIAVGLSSCRGIKYEVGVFLYKQDDSYIANVKKALEERFFSMDNISVTFYNGEGKQDTQSTQIDSAIAFTDLFVINTVDNQSDAALALGRKIKDQGKEAIFFNREIKDDVLNLSENFCYIGTDPNRPGYMIGEMISDMIPDWATYNKYDRNGDGRLNYVMLRAEIGNPEADGRTKYSVEEANRLLKKKLGMSYEPLVIVDKAQVCDWDASKAESAMSSLWASQSNNIDLVIANNDDMASGAITALNSNGFNESGSRVNNPKKYIPIFGVDALAVAVNNIKDGKMSGTVMQDSKEMAAAIAKLANNLAEGKSLLEGTDYVFDEGTKKIRIPYSKVTAEE